MRALVFDRFGGPEVLHVAEVPSPVPSAGEAIVRLRAVGVNFADVYRRRGTYHLVGRPPYILGYEGAGVIEAIVPPAPGGEPLPALRVGDRVAFADVPHANAELVRAPLSHLVPLPDAITFDLAAALLLQGLTAQYLVTDSHPLRAGEIALVHAAAGGVGLLLVQLVKERGATVIALTSSEAKRALAASVGADHALLYGDAAAWVAEVRTLTEGRGVDVVYDSVGSTLDQSLAAARTGGHVVFYGMAGGDPKPVDPRRLMDESKSLTGGDLWNVLTSSRERVRRAAELFELVQRGRLKVTISRTFPFSRGAEAHALLESRDSTGKILLVPEHEP